MNRRRRFVRTFAIVLAAVLVSASRSGAVPALPIAIGTPTVSPPGDARPPCPTTFTFSATISTKPFGSRQESVVHYSWLRSDGHAGPTSTLLLDGTAPKTVTDTWLVTSTQQQAWERIQTDIPYPARSAKAYFSLVCHERAPTGR